jgi:Holliday junction resolvase RusA-like endonuclease
MIRFFVPGIPRTAGSKRAFVINGRAIVTEDNKRSKNWRAAVALVANEHFLSPYTGPLRATFTFHILRPKGHMGKHGVRPSAPKYPAVRPDVSKTIRATEDALTGIAWKDDAQIVEQIAAKLYTESTAGAWITIEEMP